MPLRRLRHVTGALWLLLASIVPAGSPSNAAFSAETLADGVTLFRPTAPGSGRTNSLVVEQTGGLVVIDAQPSPEAARELLRAIAARFDRPVRHLVLSHAHAEAAGGATAFPATTLIIASANTVEDLGREDFDFGAELRALATTAHDWTPPPRPVAGLSIIARTELIDAQRPIELLTQGPGHTDGDLLVHLPKQGTLYVGGLLFTGRNPYVSDGNVGGWLSRFNDIQRWAPERIVGLHGPVVDAEELRRQRGLLLWVRGRVEEGFVGGYPPDDLARQVLADDEIATRFVDGETSAFVPLLVDAVVAESLLHRRKRGLLP